MAVKRRIGAAMSGFVDAFLPAWQQQEYLKRMERGEARLSRRDLAADLTAEQELMRSDYGTEDDLETAISRIINLNPGADPDTVRQALEGAIPTEAQRVTGLYKGLDPPTAPYVTQESIMAQGGDFGLSPEAFQQAESLPSRSLMGVLKGYPGAEVPPPLMEPLEIDEEGLPSYWGEEVPEITGRWGGPAAEQIQALQAGGQQAQQAAWDAQQKRELLYQRKVSEQVFNIEGEQADEETRREIARITALAPAQTLLEMKNLREQLRTRMEFTKEERLDPDLREAVYEDQRRLALMQAVLLREPSFYHRFDPATQKQRTFMGSFTQEGNFRIEEVGAFVGMPYSPALLKADDWLKDLLVNLSIEGTFDLTTKEGMALFVERASQTIPRDQAISVGAKIAAQAGGGDPLGPGPPVSDEVLNALVNKFYAESPPVVVYEDSPMGPPPNVQGDLALPYDTYEDILGSGMGSGDDANLFGTRQVAPGLSDATINLGRIGRMMNRVSPRYVEDFLASEGASGTVLDWLTNQTAIDPRITREVIESMLYNPEGYELLVNAWNSSQAVP